MAPDPPERLFQWPQLTDRQLRGIIHAARFVLVLLGFLWLFWATPLSSRIDDDFRLATEAELAASTEEVHPLVGIFREGALASPVTVAPPTATTTTAAPSSTRPTPTTTLPRASAPGPPSSNASSPTAPSPTTPPAPDRSALAATFVDAVVAGFTSVGTASVTEAEIQCLRDGAAGSYPAAQLSAMAAVTGPADLTPGQLAQLIVLLDQCLNVETMIHDSLTGPGQMPSELADCIAPLMAQQVSWGLLIALELDPTDPGAAADLERIAGEAAEACY